MCKSLSLPGCPPPEVINGHEDYILLINSDDPATVGFAYTITGIAAGKAFTLSGQVARVEGRYTPVVISAGGIITEPRITVKDLAVTLVTAK